MNKYAKKSLLFVLLLGTVLFIMGCNQVSKSSSGSATAPDLAKAADFSIKTVDNNDIKLSVLTAERKPVVLYFFATWCDECRQNLDNLNEVYPNYENDVILVFVDIDPKENEQKILAFQKEYPGVAKGNFAKSDAAILSDYKVRFPSTKTGIDKQGNIIFQNVGVLSQTQWVDLLDDLKNS
ncbi:MAG: TlpA family protein disulfide reductase [Candidatus Woesearchaeota archaeon]|nr:TlpA family protein disulfide reductase [Candidatus Woesearchaeota archaeon]